MKRIILLVFLCLFAAWTVNAQPGKKPPKPPTPQELQKEMEKAAKKAQQDAANSQKTPPGNAYGKDKQGLEGKEFGQNRAAEAKSKKEMEDAITHNLIEAAQLHKQTLEKIAAGKVTLDAKLKAKQISEADYKAKKKAFDDLEAKVKELQKKNEELKK